MQSQNIRIRLKAFDYRVLDASTEEIVNTAKRTGAQVRGPIPLPNKMFLPNRENSLGTNLFSEKTIAKLENFFSLSNENHNAHSLILNKWYLSSQLPKFLRVFLDF